MIRRRRDWKADVRGAFFAAVLAVPAAAAPAGPLWAAGSDGIDRPYPPAEGAGAVPVQPPADPEAFSLSAVEASVERDAPEICAQFSKIPDPEQPAGALVALTTEDGAPVAAAPTRRGKALCFSGLEHGKTYRLTASGDLRAVNGRTLGEAVDRLTVVAERKPSLAFRDAGFLLTRIGDGRGDPELALRSVNLPAADLRLLRSADADGLERAYFEAGDPTLIDRLAKDAREVWRGSIALDGRRNRVFTTPLPLEAVAGKLEPGVYVATAEAGGENTRQWFIVSDLAVNTVAGDDGLLIFTRARAAATALDGVSLRVVARDRSEIAQSRTGADGLARFDSAQLSGGNERAPQALFARRGADVAVVELSGPRNAVGADADENPFQRSRLDAFIAPDRPAYAPGDVANLAALLRDADGREAAGETLIVELRRPDGALAERRTLTDAGGGGYVFSMRVPTTAQPGDWRAALFDEAGGEAVGETVLRVDAARPLGLSLTLSAETATDVETPAAQPSSAQPSSAPLSSAPPSVAPPPAPPALRVTVHAVNPAGRPAVGLSGRLFISVRKPQVEYPGHPGFLFGVDAPPAERKLLGSFVVGADGKATVRAAPPEGLPYNAAFDARIEAEIAAAGAAVARAETTLPYRPRPPAIGLRPRFEGGGVPDNATVAFDVLAVDGAGRPVDVKGLTYELVREESAFEWFDNQGRWDYRPTARDRVAAGGAVDVAAAGPATVSEPVGAGVYRLDVRDPATGARASRRFTAGWWMSPRAGARPDRVELSAMRPGARAEGKAWVFIRPPYAGEVLILVADQRVRRAETRNIGPDGAFIEIPAEYGARAGVHVLAAAFAAPDPDYRGPPRRAAGSLWLPVAEGPRRLPLTVEATLAGRAPAAPVAVPAPVSAPASAPAAQNAAQNDETAGRTPAANAGAADGTSPVSAPPASASPASDASVSGPVASGSADSGAMVVRLRVPGAKSTVYAAAALLPPGAAQNALGDPALYFFGERPLGVGLRDVYGRLLSPPDGAKRSGGVTAPPWAGRSGPVWPGAVWMSPVTELSADGEAVLTVVPPPGAPAGDYRVTALAWDGQTMGRAEATLFLPASGAGASQAASAASFAPVPVWRKAWSGELPAGGEIARPAAVPVDAPASTFVEAATAVDLDAAEAAARVASALPPLGAASAASRLIGLSALRLADAPRDAAVLRALDELLAMQRPDGAFAAWNPAGPPDPWLTAFAVDALNRLRRIGGQAPEPQIKAAQDWLRRWWDGCWNDPANLPACAYALATLTEAKRLDGGAVAFFADGFAAQLPNDLARAHLAVAYDNAGDRRQAEAAFARAAAGRRVDAATRDHGSVLRDAAAAATLAAERRIAGETLTAAVGRLQRTRASVYALGEQEAGWLTAAAAALAPPNAAGPAPQNGAARPPILAPMLAPTGDDAVLRNPGPGPVRLTVLAPAAARPTTEEGARLTVRYADLTGAPVDPAGLKAGDVLTATVEANFPPEDWARVVRLTAPLSAGVEPLVDPAIVAPENGPVKNDAVKNDPAKNDEGKSAASLLRGRADRTAATAAALVPPGVGSVAMSFLLRATADAVPPASPAALPGAAFSDSGAVRSATLEPLGRAGRLTRLTAP